MKRALIELKNSMLKVNTPRSATFMILMQTTHDRKEIAFMLRYMVFLTQILRLDVDIYRKNLQDGLQIHLNVLWKTLW